VASFALVLCNYHENPSLKEFSKKLVQEVDEQKEFAMLAEFIGVDLTLSFLKETSGEFIVSLEKLIKNYGVS